MVGSKFFIVMAVFESHAGQNREGIGYRLGGDEKNSPAALEAFARFCFGQGGREWMDEPEKIHSTLLGLGDKLLGILKGFVPKTRL